MSERSEKWRSGFEILCFFLQKFRGCSNAVAIASLFVESVGSCLLTWC